MLLTETGIVKLDLASHEVLQAVPPAADYAEIVPTGGPGRIDSWDAFKAAALKLKAVGHQSVKLEIDKNTPLDKFFPAIPKSVFQDTPFKDCALEYRFDAEEDRPAGAFLVAEIELQGSLKQLGQIFSTVLNQPKPVLRVTAFLGRLLDSNAGMTIESLTLVGSFIGCNIYYPADSKLIRITSLGAAISIARDGEASLLDATTAAVLPSAVAEDLMSSLALQENLVSERRETVFSPFGNSTSNLISVVDSQIVADGLAASPEENGQGEKGKRNDGADPEEAKDQNDRTHIKYSIFGTVELPVPGQPLPLSLDLNLSIAKELILFTMSPKGTKRSWDDVFGFENIDLEDVTFKVGYLLKAKKHDGDEEDNEMENGGDGPDRSVSKSGADLAKEHTEERKDDQVAREGDLSDSTGRFEMEKEGDEETQPFIALQASWECPIGKVAISGRITQILASSFFKGTLHDVTFEKIKQLFERTQGAQ